MSSTHDPELLQRAREFRALLNILAKFSHQALEQHLQACQMDISGLQYGVMRIVAAHPHTSSELSRLLVLDPSTLVPVIDALESRGYIQRGKDPHDRRRMPLSLTDEGSALLASIPPASDHDVFFAAFAALDTAEQEALLGGLRRLMRQMPQGDDMLHNVAQRVQRGAAGGGSPPATS